MGSHRVFTNVIDVGRKKRTMDRTKLPMTKPADENRTIEQPAFHQPFWRSRRCWIIAAVVAVLLFFVIIPTATVMSKKNRATKSSWEQRQISSDLETAQFIKLGGTWSDRLLVAGTKGSSFFVENHQYDDNDNVQRVGGFEEISGSKVLAVGVNDLVTRVVLALDGPLRFVVYSRYGEDWRQFSEPIGLDDLPDAAADSHSPKLMLSDDGKTLAIAVQGAKAGVFTFEEAVAAGGAAFPGKWVLRGNPLFDKNKGNYGDFATFASMSGDAQILAVASELNRLSLHQYVDGQWATYAEYDESPRPGLGSLSLASDGSTIAVGSYEGPRVGIGQLHIVNAVWPWFLDEGRESTIDLSNVVVQVALSKWGTTVLFGRFPTNDGGLASLEVFEYIQLENKWESRGGPLLTVESASPGKVDLSSDGYRAAAIIDGKVSMFEYKHDP
jgi:hypothetical protein